MRGNILLIVVLLCGFIKAQDKQVSGKVIDLESLKPVKEVVLQYGNSETRSDSLGEFRLTLDFKNPVFLVLSHPAYKKLKLNVSDSSALVHPLYLEPKYTALDEVEVKTEKENSFGISRLNNIEGTVIYAGKKSEAVYLQDLQANLATNNSRQIFSKVPGINIFENDGSGMQVGVGGRGLNPNRISNFNTRQNGYDISADALGYPESYYTPPAEAVERIEILRGAAGLQFGTQFGGLINYKLMAAPLDKKLAVYSRQTAGSFGLFNSFNRLAGTSKKFSYNTFYQYKTYNGWRERSQLNSHTAFVSLNYAFSSRLNISAEYTFLNYLAQQPGGLTDKQFNENPAFVNRHRNWFKVNWNLLALKADYKVNESTKLNVTAFGLKAGRDALGYLGRPDRADDTSAYRNLLSDVYTNFGVETRLLKRYSLLDKQQHFLLGVRYYRGQTERRQGDAGKGDRAVFRFLNPVEPENSAYEFPSQNVALFSENIFQLNKRWTVTPGIRMELIKTESQGYYRLINKNLAGGTLLDAKIQDSRSNERKFILFGMGTQFKTGRYCEVYANFSQNYRSINFNDMRVLNPNFAVDPELKDERGFTLDGGWRGSLKNKLYFDIGLFMLNYENRIGTTLISDPATFQVIRYRTNIGSSLNQGVEAFVEADWLKIISKISRHKFSTFMNLALIDARYTGKQKTYEGKKVEYVPGVILRSGLTWAVKQFSVSLMHSYTSSQFSDATNAQSSASGIYGTIPAYSVADLSASYTYKKIGFHAGVNNLTNTVYFTRRAEGYPGPGILPADPRNFYFTLSYKP